MAKYRPVIMGARLLSVRGVIQRDNNVIHIVANHLEDRTDVLDRLSLDPMPVATARADHVKRSLPSGLNRHPRNARIIPKSRDFH